MNDPASATQSLSFPDHIGRSERASGRILAAPLELMAALLNRMLDQAGAVPPLWHWMFLQKPVLQSQIGPDGHPKRGGGLIPPIPLPRRMFAGGRVRFEEPLFAGDEIERTTTIKSISPKTGRSGTLVFLTLQNEIRGPRGMAISEEQDLVYRDAAPAGAPVKQQPAPPDKGQPGGFAMVETVRPDPVLLFRFSAATGNSHRIHYDADYVRNEEGYPNIVVHGPLQAILLADLAARHLKQPLKLFEFRALKPIFLGSPVYCAARDEGDKTTVQTMDGVHDVCMAASAQ